MALISHTMQLNRKACKESGLGKISRHDKCEISDRPVSATIKLDVELENFSLQYLSLAILGSWDQAQSIALIAFQRKSPHP